VKQNDLAEYEENAKKRKMIQIYKANHKPPRLKSSHRDDKHQAPLAKK
jgi:hypothetical protein